MSKASEAARTAYKEEPLTRAGCAHCRDDIPALCDEIAALEKRVVDLEAVAEAAAPAITAFQILCQILVEQRLAHLVDDPRLADLHGAGAKALHALRAAGMLKEAPSGRVEGEEKP